MFIYNYHPITGEYFGKTEADADPLVEGNFLIPAHATTTPPPIEVNGKIRIFTNGVWGYIDEPVEPGEEPQPDVPITADDIDRERDRRIAAGFMFENQAYQSRTDDRENIAGASTLALGAMVAGAQPGDLRWANPDVDFTWIAANNDEHPMDAQTMFAFGKTALAHKEAHIRAGKALKNIDPIPEDYTDDQYWPGS